MFNTVCIDCVVDWGEWGACADGVRSRSQVVVQETVGAGATCPDLDLEDEGKVKIKYTFILHDVVA